MSRGSSAVTCKPPSRQLHCATCRQHGILVSLKGHKGRCPYKQGTWSINTHSLVCPEQPALDAQSSPPPSSPETWAINAYSPIFPDSAAADAQSPPSSSFPETYITPHSLANALSPSCAPAYEPLSSPNFPNDLAVVDDELTDARSPDIFDSLAQIASHSTTMDVHMNTVLHTSLYATYDNSNTLESYNDGPITDPTTDNSQSADNLPDFGFSAYASLPDFAAPSPGTPENNMDISSWLNTASPQPAPERGPSSTPPTPFNDLELLISPTRFDVLLNTEMTPNVSLLDAPFSFITPDALESASSPITGNTSEPLVISVTHNPPPADMELLRTSVLPVDSDVCMDQSQPAPDSVESQRATTSHAHAAGHSTAKTQGWRSNAITLRKDGTVRGVSKRHAGKRTRGFIENVDKRSKSHSEQVSRIMSLIRKLDRETAPFIVFYVSRPESVALSHGGNHTHVSDSLQDALGKKEVAALLDNIHVRCRDSMRKALQETRDSIALNIQVTQARRAREAAEHKQEEAKRVLADVSQLLDTLCAGSGNVESIYHELEQLSHSIAQ